jgi:hypothetical protein
MSSKQLGPLSSAAALRNGLPNSALPPTPPIATVNRNEVERLAYSYWRSRGCPVGSSEEDWLLAEHDLIDEN